MTRINTPFLRKGQWAGVCAFAISTIPFVLGQENDVDQDDVYVLSPFEVSSSSDIGYQAVDTLAGTRLRTSVRDVANAISIVNEEFMKDTGATDAESLLVYTAGTEVGGMQGNFAGVGDGTNARQSSGQLINPQSNTRVRGLAAADNVRGFYLTDIPWDSYNTSRVDIQRGANSILFGIGSPAGIINANVIEAQYADFGKIEHRFDDNSSNRVSADYNMEVLPQELAARIAVLSDHQNYQQKPAYENDDRFFGTMRWDPKFLKIGSSRTTLKINYEKGNIDSNHPRILPPTDRITPWFDSSNESIYKKTFNAMTINTSDYEAYIAAGMPTGFGAAQSSFSDDDNNVYTNPNYSAWVSTPSGVSRAGDVYDGPIVVYLDPNSDQSSGAINGQRDSINATPDGEDALGSSFGGIASYETYARVVGLPGSSIGGYKEKSLTDSGIFDFYKNLLDGPNKHEWNDFEAFNISLSQNFFNDKLGFEFAYDMQDVDRGQTQNISGNGYSITVDVLSVLPNGQSNPNVGKAMVLSRGEEGTSESRDRDTWRFTGYGELDFKDIFKSDSILAEILGRHRFTAMYQYNEIEVESYAWQPFSSASNYISYGSIGNSISASRRQVGTLSYISDSLLALDDVSDADISRIDAVRSPQDTTILLWDWTKNDDGSYVGWTEQTLPIWNASDSDEKKNLYTAARKELDEVSSTAFIWQGFLLKDHIIPTVGWRHDEDKYYNSGNPKNLVTDGLSAGLDISDSDWKRPDEATNIEKGDSLTWGVVAHTPEMINKHLPWGMNLSAYYGRSENFQPAAGRVDIFANPIASPEGKTKEYGVTISALDDRISLKLNWYKTTVSNATLSGALPNSYMIGAGEAWAYMFANQALYAYENNRSVGTLSVDYDPNPDRFVPWQPREGQTLDEVVTEMKTACEAYLANPAPESLQDAWGFDTSDWYGNGDFDHVNSWINSRNSVAGNLAVTGDTESKGFEAELTAQILDNWNITLNVTKTSATRLNMGSTYADWIEDRWAFYQTEAGNVRFWENGRASNETLRSKFEAELYGNYQLYRQLEGSDVPELRHWRYNLVTNYIFRGNLLDGIRIGGAWRWQDEVTLGYPSVLNDEGNYVYDIDNPYKGGSESDIDLWIGYSFKVTKDIEWDVQLNVRNAFGENELIPVSVQTDGTPAVYRIKEGPSWSITNTIKF